MAPYCANGVKLSGLYQQIKRQFTANSQNHQRKQNSKLLGAQAGADLGTDLSTDHTAYQQ